MIAKLLSFFKPKDKNEIKRKELRKRIEENLRFLLSKESPHFNLRTSFCEDLIVIEVIQTYFEDLGYEVTRSISLEKHRAIIASFYITPEGPWDDKWKSITVRCMERRNRSTMRESEMKDTTEPFALWFDQFIPDIKSCFIKSD